MNESRIESILAVDIGAVMTKAVLVARVEGTYRFVGRGEAPSTVERPWLDLIAGVDHALEHLAAVTCRTFLDEHGHLLTPERADGQGVDVCVITVSASAPLRMVLVGLSPDMSMSSLQRAASCTNTQVVDVLTRRAAGSQVGRPATRLTEQDGVRRVFRARPVVVCIVGGTDGGAEAPVLDLVDNGAVASSLLGEAHRPHVVFAGNASLRARVAELIGSEADVRVADNVQPSVGVENINSMQAELEWLYQATKTARLPGYNGLTGWTTLPMLPTCRAVANVAQYLSLEETRKGVLCLDVGAASTSVAAARAGQVRLHVRSDLGTALSARQMVQAGGMDAVLRWLPFEASAGEIEAVVAAKELHPVSVPQDSHELLIEQALTRETIRQALASARASWPPDLQGPYPTLLPYLEPIIGAGSVLGHAPRPGQAALMLLDALEPIGVTTLVADTNGLVPALGACSLAQPLATVQALGAGALSTLGTAVTPVCRTRLRQGETLLGVKIKYQYGGDLEVEVAAGSLEVLPLPSGQKATLTLRPRRDVDVGRGGPGKGGKPIEVLGGSVGLIIDARGRPLALPSNPDKRRERVQQWLWDVGA